MPRLACASEVPSVGCLELRLLILLGLLLGFQRVTCYSVEISRPDSHLRQLNPSLFTMGLTDQFWKVLVRLERPRDLGLGSICRRGLCAGERGW